MLINGMFFQLLAPFAEDSSMPNDKYSTAERFAPVLEYIDTHCRGKLTVASLAKIASLERTYFSNLFSKTFGVSVKKYILRKKIDQASRRLLDPGVKIDAAGREFGFRDGFHFSKVFKKLNGIPPSEFIRERHKIVP